MELSSHTRGWNGVEGLSAGREWLARVGSSIRENLYPGNKWYRV